MKRASYKFGVRWIAQNDEPTFTEVKDIASQISTLLLADLFEVHPSKVAKDILKARKQEEPK